MSVLVTGVAGYVGSVCAELLLQRGYGVVGVDNLSEGHRAAVPRDVDFRECGIADPEELNGLFRKRTVDAVMHFAASSLVERSVREPSGFYVSNVADGIRLLDAMVGNGVTKIIFSSTAAVYGEPQEVPISEEHPTQPINPYGRSKLLFERVLEEYGACTGLQWVSLRYFNAAGASERCGEDHRPETHIIPILLEVALGQRERFQINGTDYPTPDGTCIRDYVHVLDIAEAHVLALERLPAYGGSGQVFNVGNGQGFSVREVVEAVRRVTGKPVPAMEGRRRPGDPARLVAGADKLRQELDWRPRWPDLGSIVGSAWKWKVRNPDGYAS